MTELPLLGAIDQSRAVLRVSGLDAESFLQGLLTNDISGASADQAVYAALLTPQGKFLFDGFVLRPDPKQFLIDLPATDLDPFAKRLSMYKLRAQIEIARAPVYKTLLLWPTSDGEPLAELQAAVTQLALGYVDPRASALGVRALVESVRAGDAGMLSPLSAAPGDIDAYHARRVRLGVPISGDDLVRDESYPLEIGLDHINGVDFRKGCYVGQEVTARMKHKATLKKALYFVDLAAAPNASPGDELTVADRSAGVLGSAEAGVGLALLRADRAQGELAVDGGGSAAVKAAVFAAAPSGAATAGEE
ncbi:MAG: folate-binding protein [Neomegalonema sp.]|nr:folate-binding protein [Neomegalonema sp.]